MTDFVDTVVIVGASLAGASAAAELRELGFAGEIRMVGLEARAPYERPPITKSLLRGETEPAEAAVHPESFYAEHDIELLLDRRAESIDRDARRLVLAGGRQLDYDRLLIATGANPIRLRVPGADLDGVVVLRTIDDALALRARLEAGRRVAVIGGGWIGMEAAASLTQIGADVTVVEAAAAPLERVLGTTLGSVFADLHREHGVEVLTGASLESFEGAGGRLTAAVLAGGRRVDCDITLVGVGVRPAHELAERAGLKVSDGIEVGASLRTSDPSIYAAGDVALARHPRYGPLRVEHWDNARSQGRTAARAIFGQDVVHDAIPFFFSDQYDLGLEYRGHARPEDELVIRGDLAAREFVAFWLRDGRVTAAMNVNVWDVGDQLQAVLEAHPVVSGGRLADPAIPLEVIAGARA